MTVTASLPTESTPEGEQILVPGVAPVGLRDRLALRMAAPMTPRKPQKPLNIGLFDEDDPDSNPRVLKKIARATGGEAFFPDETSAVIKICEGIAGDIRNQYTIGYAPTNEKLDGTYRTINMTVTSPRGGKLLVRTRAGYIASPNRNPAAVSQDGGR